MATTTTTTIDDMLPTIVAESEFTVRAQSIFYFGGPGRPWIDVRDLVGQAGNAIGFPIRSQFTAYDVTEGVDHALSQAMSTSKPTVTATEIVAITTIEDLAQVSSKEDEASKAAIELGAAIAAKYDSKVFALNNGLDVECGTTTANLTGAMITTALETLATAKAPPPYLGLLHTHQWGDLVTESSGLLKPAAGSAWDTENLVRDMYILAEFMGVKLIISPLIPLANADADRSGAIISNRAYGLLDKWPLRIEKERDASRRATELVATLCFGVGEKDGTMGVALESGYA